MNITGKGIDECFHRRSNKQAERLVWRFSYFSHRHLPIYLINNENKQIKNLLDGRFLFNHTFPRQRYIKSQSQRRNLDMPTWIWLFGKDVLAIKRYISTFSSQIMPQISRNTNCFKCLTSWWRSCSNIVECWATEERFDHNHLFSLIKSFYWYT